MNRNQYPDSNYDAERQNRTFNRNSSSEREKQDAARTRSAQGAQNASYPQRRPLPPNASAVRPNPRSGVPNASPRANATRSQGNYPTDRQRQANYRNEGRGDVRPMSEEFVSGQDRQRRQRPTGISFDNQRQSAPSEITAQRGKAAVSPADARASSKHRTFDLNFGEDKNEEASRKAPKAGNSSRPVVISAMLLAAVMLTIVIFAVTTKDKKQNYVTDSDGRVQYVIPEKIKIANQRIRTDTDAIDLAECGLTDINDLSYCFLVQSLFLQGNQITDITPLKGCTALQTLDLSGNNIADIGALSDMTKLSDLKLQKNHIYDLAPLEDKAAMEYLDISHNEVYEVYSLSNMGSLRQLYASYNSISDISSLATLTSLTTLELANNDIYDISVLVNMTDLASLVLANNNIQSVRALSTMTNLKILDLSGNPITDISPLSSLSSLLELNLKGTSVSAEDVAALRKALPDCNITV